ncbi:hypothetical protein PVAND_009487 [Polypedilum vanderplanki]|uniref:Uncharacterized protein n=1 Tax=Polypedilum vanderplanki TaxID=319348 RepID=A0A9J6CDQ1_POLVA|nr:hypothetical protein PVAND_009487 [Polypedilum vanderplanki]
MEENNQNPDLTAIKVKQPRRILHCSDGIYEEYSDEDEPVNKENLQNISFARKIGHQLIYGLDYVGEAIANFLNITTPKYAYEINQFKKMEEERLKEEQELKDNTWQIDSETAVITVVPAQQNEDNNKY